MKKLLEQDFNEQRTVQLHPKLVGWTLADHTEQLWNSSPEVSKILGEKKRSTTVTLKTYYCWSWSKWFQLRQLDCNLGILSELVSLLIFLTKKKNLVFQWKSCNISMSNVDKFKFWAKENALKLNSTEMCVLILLNHCVVCRKIAIAWRTKIHRIVLINN